MGDSRLWWKIFVEKVSFEPVVVRQTNRNNVVDNTASQYFKRAVSYPYDLDCTLQTMQEQFSSHLLTILKLILLYGVYNTPL